MDMWRVFLFKEVERLQFQLPSSLSMCGSPIVPRKGDRIVFGLTLFCVKDVVWDYREFTVTIFVDPCG